MPRPRFNETLDILGKASDEELEALAAAGLNPELPLSVCAMGPVPPGDEIISMRVWVWQQTDDQVAASAGNGGVHLGGHAPAPSEKLPFKAPDWMIQTQLEPGSEQFSEGKPALATAMALVRRDGTLEIDLWSQAVMIGAHDGSHG
jgi:hypothetical protein